MDTRAHAPTLQPFSLFHHCCPCPRWSLFYQFVRIPGIRRRQRNEQTLQASGYQQHNERRRFHRDHEFYRDFEFHPVFEFYRESEFYRDIEFYRDFKFQQHNRHRFRHGLFLFVRTFSGDRVFKYIVVSSRNLYGLCCVHLNLCVFVQSTVSHLFGRPSLPDFTLQDRDGAS